MSGCLKRSGDNFVLAADNGQSVNLTGDSSLLKPHEGHAIHVLGTLASDGSLQVSHDGQPILLLADHPTTGGYPGLAVRTAADIDRAADGAVWGAFALTGQVCISVERCYVEEPVYDEFVSKVVQFDLVWD